MQVSINEVTGLIREFRLSARVVLPGLITGQDVLAITSDTFSTKAAVGRLEAIYARVIGEKRKE